jgi:DNA-directed RNA polymerase subunit E'/Rpb7
MEATNVITKINDLYIDQIIQTKETLLPYDIPKDPNKKIGDAIVDYLIKKVNARIGGRCIDAGYVKSNTETEPRNIEIITRSVGTINAAHFNGEVYYHLQVKCRVCKPAMNQVIEGRVVGKSKHCIMVLFGPLQIAIPTTHHNDASYYNNLEKDDKVQVRIISYKYKLNDESIQVIGQFVKKV